MKFLSPSRLLLAPLLLGASFGCGGGGSTPATPSAPVTDAPPLGSAVLLSPILTSKPTFPIDTPYAIQFTGATDIDTDAFTVEKYLAICNHSSMPIVAPTLADSRWTVVKPSSVTANVVGNSGRMSGTYNINVYPLVHNQIGTPVTATIQGVWSVPQFTLAYSDDWNSVPHPNGEFLNPIELKLLMGLPGKGVGTVAITPPTGVSLTDIKSTTVSLSDPRYITWTVTSPTLLTFQTIAGDGETDYLTRAEILTYATVTILYHDPATSADATFTKIFTIINDIKYIGHGQ